MQQRRLKAVRLIAGVSIALLVVILLKRIGNEAEDVLKQNLTALEKLNQVYQEANDASFSIQSQGKPKVVKPNQYNAGAGTGTGSGAGAGVGHKKPTGVGSISGPKCPSYLEYSKYPHPPFSKGPWKLPFQRPQERCRTFRSQTVDDLITELLKRMADPDLARLTENALPNTLDTTILYHSNTDPLNLETFVVTGDIHAEWLRDSARQLSIYQSFIKFDPSLKDLIKGAIHTQSKYISVSPYCNAFHPPEGSGVSRGETAMDKVYPHPNWHYVFECKWEVDSLASFLTLTREYFDATQDETVFDKLWFDAMSNLLTVLRRESSPTFNSEGKVMPFYYTFQRDTNIGTETLPLAGLGNPVNFDVGLIRSAFRPSDDSTIFQFFIPGNAYLQVELEKISQILRTVEPKLLARGAKGEFLTNVIEKSGKFAKDIKSAIYEHAIVDHPRWGKVFAYEIDGYGGTNLMDDANIPSLLSLPDLGFVDRHDEIYQNTRKMILDKAGNPYYLKGVHFKGIGGPHIGIHNAWPMSLLLQIRTTDSDEEILENLDLIKSTTGGLGLVHESIHVNHAKGSSYTRPWFSWANSEFGKTILDLAVRKPYLIFKDEYKDVKFHIDDLF